MDTQDSDTRSAFCCWHFDALSDDGREALVITFNDNYPFSPRYYRQARHGASPRGSDERCPAVTFTYSVDGKVVLRAVNEFSRDDFHEDGCVTIGKSSFSKDTAEYGSGFVLKLDLRTARRCRIEAEIEWLSVEPGTEEDPAGDKATSSRIVSLRSDVSGRITSIGRKGSETIYHFRGTGFHDEYRSDRPLAKFMPARWTGRAHFTDSTAIFRCEQAARSSGVESQLYVVRDGSIHQRTAEAEAQNINRDRYGLTVPGRLTLQTDDNIRLRIKPATVIEGGFLKKSMVSEITLTLRDGKPRKALGITEFTAPGRLGNPFFRWFTDLRIGRSGKWPWF